MSDEELLEAVRARLGAAGAASEAAIARALEEAARERGRVLGSAAAGAMVRSVRDAMLGAGPLQALLDDRAVTDVLVNGPREVWVERGGRLSRTDVDLGTPADVRALAVRLAAAGGARLDDAEPAVDARLPDGTRLHAVLPPIADGGTLISLRAVRAAAFTLEALVECGTLAPPLASVVRTLVLRRANVLVCGATGAGKTTLLAAMLAVVPSDERIVLIEEAGELRSGHPHLVRMVARRANVDGAGRVELGDLVRHAMRMRPDRIVLGECRGAEVGDVMTALNTGHDGGCATLHANAAADVPARLEALGALAGLSRAAVHAQAASAFDAVLHMRRARGLRYLAEVGVVRRTTGGLEVATALSADAGGATVRGTAWPELARRWGLAVERTVGVA
ncbi:TadA family conjugal transfer-associated ATPase [Cellulomonas edaphi]|uniref:TadA family conjugal transfer-associated ATPase n=1 Tax=Cellulomonas edaphi TaxID=3053468 RepID=A0ABT7S9J3_9CELL|nr:TadA family conjugal transfer-associated ATPase [Cellulomons edaphi]MDM7832289.1 TadA family conjugal transfer-associated ATPase [Cellulomons edaphi]